MPPAVDGAFARWLAEQAGSLLCDLRAEHGYADPTALRAVGDKHSHNLITTALQRWRPGDAVLSEEGVRDDPARLSAERVWIVDPLDGTREFAEAGRTDWAVHIALWARTSAAPSRRGGCPWCSSCGSTSTVASSSACSPWGCCSRAPPSCSDSSRGRSPSAADRSPSVPLTSAWRCSPRPPSWCV